ncbi:DUF4402 domain-containing protein [Salinimicrobium sp. CAU 1759]
MKYFLTTLLFLLCCTWASAQATANFTASATIIQPISISTITNLNFAGIDAKEGGEVVLTPQGERLVSGDVGLSEGSIVTAAAFEVVGQQGYTFSISLPGDQAQLVNGEENMTLKNFTSSTGSNGKLSTGKTFIKVGATLEINPQQAPGFYSTPTPLSITVNYN